MAHGFRSARTASQQCRHPFLVGCRLWSSRLELCGHASRGRLAAWFAMLPKGSARPFFNLLCFGKGAYALHNYLKQIAAQIKNKGIEIKTKQRLCFPSLIIQPKLQLDFYSILLNREHRLEI